MDTFNALKEAMRETDATVSETDLYAVAQALAADNKVIVDSTRHAEGEKLIENRDGLRRVLG